MINTIYITRLEEIIELIFDQEYDGRIDRHRSPFLYRGLPCEYPLKTSLQRNCKHKSQMVESSILRNFSKYADSMDLQEKSIWYQMAIGQHYGLPTRLLDWTYSPLMALHFATSVKNMESMDTANACIWKINIVEQNRELPDEYRMCLAKENAYLFTIPMLSSLVTTLEKYDSDMGDSRFVLLEPPSIDQRIINQYSYFSIMPSGIQDIEAMLEEQAPTNIKYIISKDLKWRIRDMLDQMNINERIAFPGLDGLSRWMKRHYYVK